MSYVSKKNLKLKNISYISPINHTKLNVSNLLSETQRIISSSNISKNNTQQISNNNIYSPKVQININKGNNILNELYRSYSTNRPNNSNQSLIKKKNNNANKNFNLNRSSSNKNKKTSPSPSAMLTTFANFAQNLYKNKNPLFSNMSIKSKNYRRNPQSNIEIRFIKKGGLTSNNSLTNLNNKSNNGNLFSSSNISYINQN